MAQTLHHRLPMKKINGKRRAQDLLPVVAAGRNGPRAWSRSVHGFNSHSGYYTWAAEQLVGQRPRRLRARPARPRQVRRRALLRRERSPTTSATSTTLVALAKSREPGLPVFLLGHSAGGVVSCIYTLEHQAELAGLICESFAFQVPAPDFALAVLKGLSHVAPHAHVLQAEERGLLARSARWCRR